MNWLRDLLHRVRIRFSGNGTVDELDEELHDHITRQVEHYVTQGMTPDEARRQAIIEFGAVEKAREECREQRQVAIFETLTYDLRYALRGLRRSASVAIATILTFAIGIGATTAIFSLVEGVLLRPLPFFEPDRLVLLGDIVELASKLAARTPMEVAKPVLRAIGERVGSGGEIVLVPGNHDAVIVRAWVRGRGSPPRTPRPPAQGPHCRPAMSSCRAREPTRGRPRTAPPACAGGPSGPGP